MPYSPISKNDINQMLKALNLKSLDDLFKIIPNKYRINLSNSTLPNGLSEQEVL